MVQPADLGFLKFELSPRLGIFSASDLTISSILRRAATPFCRNSKKASCAAAQASSAVAKTPNLPRKAGAAEATSLVLPAAVAVFRRGGCGCGLGGGDGLAIATAVPALRTPLHGSKFHSRHSWFNHLTLALKISFPKTSTLSTMPMMTASTGASFMPGASRALLPWREHHQFAFAGAEAIHRHNGVRAGPEFGRIFFVHQLRAQQ